MIRPSMDPERIRAALGIPTRPHGSVEEALTALAALKAKRERLGIDTPSPYPPGATPEERRALAQAALEELVRAHRPVSSWGLSWR
ncbi:hypothetical protein MOX01_20420 [Microbacterium oxydans]|nr:hypothetical protein MOX01_20420 [Microbacterium oxydans]